MTDNPQERVESFAVTCPSCGAPIDHRSGDQYIECVYCGTICEVDRIDQIEPALQAGATRLLLDNMEPDTLREAVGIVAGRVPTEASGGINLQTIRAKAATGVDFVSVGRLTQSAPAADIGLDFTPL